MLIICSHFSYIFTFKEWWEDSKIFELNNENFSDYVGKEKAQSFEKLVQEALQAKAKATTAEEELNILQSVHKKAAAQGIDTRSGAVNMIMQALFTGTAKARALMGEGTEYLKSVGAPTMPLDKMIEGYDFIKGL